MERAVVLQVGVTFEQIENEHLRNLLVFRVWIIWTGTKKLGGHCPTWLPACTRCVVFPLTCSIQCLGRLKRHNTSIFLCWFSFLLGRTQQKIDQMRAEDPEKNPEKLRRSMHAIPVRQQKAEFILQFPTVAPSSTRLWLPIPAWFNF